MKTQQNKITVPALTEAWHDFPWAEYPGGVKVTFVLMPENGGGVVLLRTRRNWYELPELEMSQNDTLEQKLADFNQQLKQLGVSYIRGKNSPESLGGVSKGGVFHALVHVPYVQIGPASLIELVPQSRAYQIKSALNVSNKVSPYLPAVLGWEEFPNEEVELATT